MNNPFEVIETRLSSIENLILDLKNKPVSSDQIEESDQLLTVQEAASFLGLTVPTIYSKKSKGELPVCKPNGSKKLYFSKQDLIQYVKAGQQKSNIEIKKEAEIYLSKK